MTKNIFRNCAIAALVLAASQAVASAQNPHSIQGVWLVNVTVTNCQTGALIRTVQSVQTFNPDGSVSETLSLGNRGSSIGVWTPGDGPTFGARYWFFRYTPTETFASIAAIVDLITLSQDGSQFTSSGTVQDFDASGDLLDTGCFVHAAKRLASLGPAF